MRHRPNPYRVLAFALDVGDHRLAELLTQRLFACGRASTAAPGPAAEATVERLLALLRADAAHG